MYLLAINEAKKFNESFPEALTLKDNHYFSVTTFTHHNLGTQKNLESPKRNSDSL